MPTITFSLKTSQWDALEAVAEPGESRNLAAKRIFLGALGDPETSAPDPDAFEYLRHQVERLEERLGICPDLAGLDRLDKIEERLECLANLQSHAAKHLDRLDELIQEKPAPPSRLPKATQRALKTEGETP